LVLFLVSQFQSLQALIKESKSTASVAAHQRHVAEYQALLVVLRKCQERFGDKRAFLFQGPFDSDDSSGEEDEPGRNTRTSQASITRRRNNNDDAEEGHMVEEKGSVVPRGVGLHGDSKLDREFKTIDLEVREGNYEMSRRKENEVSI